MNTKLILLIILLLGVAALVVSIIVSKRSEIAPKKKYAQLLLPNGNYIQGKCEKVKCLPYECVEISIEGTLYRAHVSRIVIWESDS